MENDVKEFLSELLKQLKSIDYIKPEDIPNIDLYMDQVTTFMEDHLSNTKRSRDDKILTKTMINNYAKNDLLPPPEKYHPSNKDDDHNPRTAPRRSAPVRTIICSFRIFG